MMGFEITGLDDLTKELDNMVEKAEKLGKMKTISMKKLFDHGFLESHTRFKKFADMMNLSGFDWSSQDKFDAIPVDELNKFIQSVSRYKSFENMLSAARTEYCAKELGF